MNPLKICPYMEYSLQILGRKWNGLILHYLSLCDDSSSHFSTIKRDLPNITPKALSQKLSELIEHELIVKKVVGGTPVSITYELSEKGRSLVASIQPLQAWARPYVDTKSQANYE